jgi:hypothetical protein
MPRTQLKRLAMGEPTYTPVKTYEEEMEVRAMIEKLRVQSGSFAKKYFSATKAVTDDHSDPESSRDSVPHCEL